MSQIIIDDIQKSLGHFLTERQVTKIAVLVDENTYQYCYPLIKEILPEHLLIQIKSGEINKNIDTCQEIWEAMTKASFDRKSLLINLGGGVIGDMGGFCAASYKRGINFVNIPTTLLAAVDANVGGKLGIDFMGFKNHIGFFQDPEAVFIDTTFLNTLPKEELRSGFAEVIKHGLIADQHYFNEIKKEGLDQSNWPSVIAHSNQIKQKIVNEDPYEKGLRKVLNYGHSIGHAIESFYLETDNRLLHGEAISIGMICEAFLSKKVLNLTDEQLNEICSFILGIYSDLKIEKRDFTSIISLMHQDKKNINNLLNHSLLYSIGVATYDISIDEKQVLDALYFYLSKKNPLENRILKRKAVLNNVAIPLEASKSESNRALIINALSGNASVLQNLSNARDTQTMQKLLKSQDEVLDVLDAGTTMRFLTAYSLFLDRAILLTGTDRMQQRPIKILVDALKKIGGKIKYKGQEGFPPIKIKPLVKQKVNEIKIKGDVSSQYISALLMIAPSLEQGLLLHLKGKIGSKPYIQMTLDMMKLFGIQSSWTNNSIEIPPQPYLTYPYVVESDWSGASYWYSFVALANEGSLKLLGLRQKSLQGDIAIVHIMNRLGVMSTFEDDGVVLKKIPHQKEFEYDFSDCPDLAQTVAVVCGIKGIHCRMTGLESLKIKETDRIKALKKELKKFKIKLKEVEEGVWEIKSKFIPSEEVIDIKTYDDHRMAMAFAPICTHQDIKILDPSVVNKSYPSFWEHLDIVTSS